MADIESGGGGGHKKGGGKAKPKKHSTRVDFTPMVDLGFLLITFFMLTTTMSKPQTMEITFPVDEKIEDPPKIDDNRVMTIILDEKDRIFYYFGLESMNFQTTNYSKDGIRKVLLKENRDRNPRVDSIPILKEQVKKKIIEESVYKERVMAIKRQKGSLVVFIKPTDESNYKNVIDIFDEMSICNIGSYSIVDITDVEKKAIAEAKAAALEKK